MRPLPQSIIFVLVVGLIIRLGFIFLSHHFHHPDELYQSLEITTRLVYGYGIIPWDYSYGLRSFITPFLLTIPMYLTKLLSLPPAVGLLIIKSVLSLISMAVVLAGYLGVQKLTQNNALSFAVAWSLAIWYELVYFSARPLTENLATISVSLAIISLLLPKKPIPALAGFFMVSACLWRIQYALPILAVLYSYRKSVKYHQQRASFLKGSITSLLLFGLTDFITYKIPFAHIYHNVSLSLLSGISQQFGTRPFSAYIFALFIASGGLYVFAPFSLNISQKTKPILYATGLLLLIHSFISHKEYRFLVLVFPVLLTLSTIGFFACMQKLFKSKQNALSLTLLCVSILSLVGFSYSLPGLSTVYATPPFTKDPVLALSGFAGTVPSACGVFIPERFWVYSGGYTSLGKNIPLYTQDVHPSKEQNVNLLILSTNIKTPPPGYTSIKTLGGFILYQREGPCLPDINYSTIRSFDFLNTYLSNKKMYQFDFLK